MKWARVSVMGLVAAAVGSLGWELWEEQSVIAYDTDTLQSAVNKKPNFVLFYAPWCGHCENLRPNWEKLGQKYNPDDDAPVKIGMVDCTQHTELCSHQDVTIYPTLKLFLKDSQGGVRYRGPRDEASLERFIAEQLGKEWDEDEDEVYKAESGLVEYTKATFKATVPKGKHFVKFHAPWCGHCQRLAPTWDALAKSFEHDASVTIGKLDCTKFKEICEEYEVKGYPTLLWLSDGKKIKKYSGSRSHEDLKQFTESMLKLEEKGGGEKEDTGATPEPPVVILTAENFENAIEKGFTFVKFFAPWCGHCKRMGPTYDELGRKFVGHESVTVAKVDCTQEVNRALCSQQNVNGFPTLYLYNAGERVSEYNGDRSLQDMAAFITRHLSHDEL